MRRDRVRASDDDILAVVVWQAVCVVVMVGWSGEETRRWFGGGDVLVHRSAAARVSCGGCMNVTDKYIVLNEEKSLLPFSPHFRSCAN